MMLWQPLNKKYDLEPTPEKIRQLTAIHRAAQVVLLHSSKKQPYLGKLQFIIA
jgi:hypothetical protein